MTKPNTVIAIKGFNPDLTCRGFQYEVGKTYEQKNPAVLCGEGFHAVTMPLDVLQYYPASKSVFHQVELTDIAPGSEDHDDSKVAGRVIKIGAKVDLTGLIKAQVDFVFKNAKKPAKGGVSKAKNGLASATEENGAATASGDYGAATASGYYGAATASGDHSVALASGYGGRARGKVGTALFLTERAEDWTIVAAEAVIVDGAKIKADVYYRLRDGKVVEA